MSYIKYVRVISCFIMIIVLCTPLLLQAQPGGDEDLGDPGVPLDGGLSVLMGAAVAYGASRFRKKNNHNNETNDIK